MSRTGSCSYFILQICDKYNFEPKIIFNNYISNFLCIKNQTNNTLENIYRKINLFKNNNFRKSIIKNDFILQPKLHLENIMHDFVDYVTNSCSVYGGNIYVYCNSYPIYDISEKNKAYMSELNLF